MTVDVLKRNIEQVQSNIARACSRSGHKVTLVAATKTVPAELINAAVEFGVKNVGENRVQEYIEKRDGVIGAYWHFIGTLQRNKAKYLVGSVPLIQSVNDAKLAAEIDRLAKKHGIIQDVLIEVNAAGETAKTGAAIESIDELIAYARSLENVRVRGLMAVPPKDAEQSVYDKLYSIFSRYETTDFDILSVGMSGDYEKAIASGSNMVRLGSALFGSRT
ncbi:MAG: YggS family pyridoxal phosphate-dependent enzyme [Clostridiales bacterium]|nr:YggS family pyridoxal phosphate-dependent enzyme [Clostridiales bacterium]